MKDKVAKLYHERPDYLSLLQRCIAVHREQEKNAQEERLRLWGASDDILMDNWLGFTATSIGCWLNHLKVLENLGFLNQSYSSHRYTYWKVRDIDGVEAAMAELDTLSPRAGQSPVETMPDDLFEPIVGYEHIKSIILRSLKSDKPVHVLLVGTPSTAKSLFLQEMSRIPGARYALGSSSTRAGLVDFLLEQHPKILVMDEIDKMNMADLSVLLSLMETGIVTRLKHKMRESEKLKTWVFGAANRDHMLPPELKSRFLKFYLREYTTPEFLEITRAVLTKRESVPPELANYIAAKLSPITRDVRDAVRIARLCHNPQEVDTVVEQIWKSNEKGQ